MNLEERLQVTVSQTEADSEKWHTIIHGNENTSVETENGPVSSVAKQKKEIREEILSVVESEITACQTLKTQTQQIKSETLTIKDQIATFKSDTETLKNITENYKNQSETFKNLAEQAVSYTAGPHLLEFKWADHILNDMAWVRSDTFGWQSGTVYSNAYQHLVNDLSGIAASTETIGSITIRFYQATDGHKIVLTDQIENLEAIFTQTGIAWYFVLDTSNAQFKLPRTQWGFSGLRNAVGKCIAPGLPNITGAIGFRASSASWYSGCIYGRSDLAGGTWDTTSMYAGTAYLDASRSSSIYGSSSTVQAPGTEMYLYFYLGNFRKESVINTAGMTSETINNKLDKDLSNLSQNIDYCIENYRDNNGNWYRLYKSGRLEQGGFFAGGNSGWVSVAFTFLKPFKDTTFQIICNGNWSDASCSSCCITAKSTTGATVSHANNMSGVQYSFWFAVGQSA